MKNNKFTAFVMAELAEMAEKYDSGKVSDVVKDLSNSGCQSGMVSSLVYYSQTTPIFVQFQEELSQITAAILNETRLSPQTFLKERGWDDKDPLVLGDVNRCLIVWMAFEWVASTINES